MSAVVEQLKQCGVFYEGDDCAGGLIRDKVIAEIERLRLTDAEREAIATAATVSEGIGFEELPATLRGLLERTK